MPISSPNSRKFSMGDARALFAALTLLLATSASAADTLSAQLRTEIPTAGPEFDELSRIARAATAS